MTIFIFLLGFFSGAGLIALLLLYIKKYGGLK